MSELALQPNNQPLVMKGGLVHWVSHDTAEKIQRALAFQTAHSFMKINELGITINTAEIEGVYNLKQYEDMAKIKEGMWQCTHRIWHKRREECDCSLKVREKMAFVQRLKNRLATDPDLEPEQRKSMEGYVVADTKWLEERGVLIAN